MEVSHKSKEALFNEIKGSLFEFLVAQHLSSHSHFILTLSEHYQELLRGQSRMVREFYPELEILLKAWSSVTSEQIIKKFGHPKEVQLTGKLQSSADERELFESDLILIFQEKQIPISLKLTKKGSYLHTKSAGVKSFWESYFPCPSSQNLQIQWNKIFDQEFYAMSWDLHQNHDLTFEGDYKNWVKSGLSELPGELTGADQKRLHDFYHSIGQKLGLELENLKKNEPEIFLKGLRSLMGHSRDDLWQVMGFYHEDKINVEIHNQITHTFQKLPQIICAGDVSFVELRDDLLSLQLRLKPMNKFTTTAMKINAAIKQLF